MPESVFFWETVMGRVMAPCRSPVPLPDHPWATRKECPSSGMDERRKCLRNCASEIYNRGSNGLSCSSECLFKKLNVISVGRKYEYERRSRFLLRKRQSFFSSLHDVILHLSLHPLLVPPAHLNSFLTSSTSLLLLSYFATQ